LFRKPANCVPVENNDVDLALSQTEPADLEDGFQIVLAQKCGTTIIISNDKNGFKSSPIETMTTADFLRK
jgi:predicted nucleic acid-binding protein